MRLKNIAKVVTLNEDGRSVRYIADLLNIAKSSVHDALVPSDWTIQ
jgi:hypothetical protein